MSLEMFPTYPKIRPDQIDLTLPTVADLARGDYNGPVAYVRGYAAPFDGGEGFFYLDPSDTTTPDNGGTVLVDSKGRRWKRVYSGPVNVRWFGAVGAGDHTTAFQKAFKFPYVYVPSGTYNISAPIDVADNARVVMDNGAVIRSSGTAFRIYNRKEVHWTGGTIILNGPGNAIDIAGLWNAVFEKVKIVTGNGSNGIYIRTSQTGGQDFGAYNIQIINAFIDGSGTYGIRTEKTSGDTVRITHLSIIGGWIAHHAPPIMLSNVDFGTIILPALDSFTGNGIVLDSCTNMVVIPGEAVSPANAIKVQGTSSRISVLSTYADLDPSFLTTGVFNGTVRVFGSDQSDQGYYAELSSVYNYAQSFKITARGGGSPTNIITWGEVEGLVLRAGVAGRIGIVGTLDFSTSLATSATAGAATPLPHTPAGYLTVMVNGTSYKIPLYRP